MSSNPTTAICFFSFFQVAEAVAVLQAHQKKEAQGGGAKEAVQA